MRRLRQRWRMLWKTATRPLARFWDRLSLAGKQILVLVPLLSCVILLASWFSFEAYYATRQWRDTFVKATLARMAAPLNDELASSSDELASSNDQLASSSDPKEAIERFLTDIRVNRLIIVEYESRIAKAAADDEDIPALTAYQEVLSNVLTEHIVEIPPQFGQPLEGVPESAAGATEPVAPGPKLPKTTVSEPAPPADDAPPTPEARPISSQPPDDSHSPPAGPASNLPQQLPSLDTPTKAVDVENAGNQGAPKGVDHPFQGAPFVIWQGIPPRDFAQISLDTLSEVAVQALDKSVSREAGGRLLAARRVSEAPRNSTTSTLVLITEFSPEVIPGRYLPWRIGLMLLVAAGVIVVLVSLSHDVVVKPVKRLAERMAVVATSRDFTQRLETHRNDEIGALTTRFNEMLAEIQKVTDELKQSNDELEERVEERTAQLRRKNRDLDVYSNAIAHDLRAPIRAISFASERLRDHSDPAAAALGEKVFGLADHSQQMIEKILGLIRGRNDPLSPLWLGNPIDNTLRIMDEELRQAGAEIDLPADFPTIIGNAALLQNVFQNLITNAVKYNRRDRKRVEIRTKSVQNGRMWEVSVKDNGAGIRDEMKEKIFRPFKQIHRESEFARGNGIGLAWVRQIVELHNGDIWFESTFGEGTTFYFTLPANSPDSAAGSAT